MGYSINFVDGLDEDLSRLHDDAPSEAAIWLELIDLIYDVDAVADELMVNNGYRPIQPRFDTLPVGALLRRGFNICRVKLYRSDGSAFRHRLLYALDHSKETTSIWLLGLMPREEDYEAQQPTVKRAIADYERLQIPGVPRG